MWSDVEEWSSNMSHILTTAAFFVLLTFCGKKTRGQDVAMKTVGKMSEEVKQQSQTPGLTSKPADVRILKSNTTTSSSHSAEQRPAKRGDECERANVKAKDTEKKRSSVRAQSAKPHDRKSRRSKRSASRRSKRSASRRSKRSGSRRSKRSVRTKGKAGGRLSSSSKRKKRRHLRSKRKPKLPKLRSTRLSKKKASREEPKKKGTVPLSSKTKHAATVTGDVDDSDSDTLKGVDSISNDDIAAAPSLSDPTMATIAKAMDSSSSTPTQTSPATKETSTSVEPKKPHLT